MASASVTATLCLLAFIGRASTTADIRLTGGKSPKTGRLEVLVDGQWGTVCDTFTSFTKTEADTACRQLGFGQASDYGSYSSFTETEASVNSSLPVVMTDASCFDTSTRLQDCIFSRSSLGCSRGDDRGVTCSNCSMYLCSDGECVDGKQCDGVADCADGSDEDKFTCDFFNAISSTLSTTLKIVIAVAVVIVVLLIGIPVAICICVCMCTGACVCCATRDTRSAPTYSYPTVQPTYPAYQKVVQLEQV